MNTQNSYRLKGIALSNWINSISIDPTSEPRRKLAPNIEVLDFYLLSEVVLFDVFSKYQIKEELRFLFLLLKPFLGSLDQNKS